MTVNYVRTLATAVLVILLVTRTQTQPSLVSSLIARFQSNGIRGYVLFTENGTSTSVSTKIFNNAFNNETYSWQVFNSGYMIDNRECTIRNNNHLNFDLTLLLGPLEPIKQNLYNVNFNFVSGPLSFLGKTLILRGSNSGDMSCAIVLPFENKLTFVSNFRTKVQGIAYFLYSDNLFSIIASLYHSSPFEKSSYYHWKIVRSTSSPKATSKFETLYQNELEGCSHLTSNYILKSNDLEQISISSERSTPNSRSYINKQSVFITNWSDLYFVLYDSQKIFVCSPIEQIHPKKVSAILDEEYLTGQVVFSQESPIDPTLVDIELKTNLYSYSYGIDQLPTLTRSMDQSPDKCPNIDNIIFNPAKISPFSVPIEGLGTSDQYAIGDLSGKYGTLLQKSNEKISTVDFNLPLFGHNSVVGRALVFYAPNGTIVACVNLELSNTDTTVAFATFDNPIHGQLILKQPKNNCTENTYVYLEVASSDKNNTSTVQHYWFINEIPVFAENTWSTSECSGTGQVYNPYNKSTGIIYNRNCNSDHVFACRTGDMSQKFGHVNIQPYKVKENGVAELKKYYFTDTFLPLCGPNSVIGKSIRINKNNFSQEALSCTNIFLLESDG